MEAEKRGLTRARADRCRQDMLSPFTKKGAHSYERKDKLCPFAVSADSIPPLSTDFM